MSELKKKILEGIRTNGMQEWAFMINDYDGIMDYEKLADEDIDELATAILNEIAKQPQLNENQQIVLEYLKKICPPILQSPMVTIFCLMDDIINDNWRCYHDIKPEYIDKAENLSKVEQFEILKAFAEWGLERETE